MGLDRLVFVTIALAACGQDEPGLQAQPDAGTDAAVDAAVPEPIEPEAPAAPALPALPVLTPCPDGWIETADPDDDALVHCRPWSEGGPESCGAGEASFPGGGGCTRLGPACPAGDWPEDLPEDVTVLFVRPGAEDGTGTSALPFGAIAEAIAVAEPDSIVALARGTFDEVVEVDAAVTLWGACVDETILASSVPSESEPTVRLVGAARGLRSLTIAGARSGLEVATTGPVVEIDSIVVRDVLGTGVRVRGTAEAHLRDLAIRDVAAAIETDAALVVERGATVEVDRAALERNAYVGVVVEGGTLIARDLGVIESRPLEDQVPVVLTYLGEGLRAYGGATVDLERAVFARNSRFALRVAEAGTSLVARDVLVEDTVATPSIAFPAAIEVASGAALTLSRASFHREGQAVVVAAPSTGARIEDVIVADGGGGLSIGSDASARRIAVVRGAYSGLHAIGPSTVSDLTVRDMFSPGEPFPGGDGIGMYGPGVTFERVHLQRVTNWAVSVTGLGAGTDATIRDLTVELAPVEGARGFGATFTEGAHALVERAVFDGGGAYTVWARGDDTQVTLSDVVIRRSRGLDRANGFGLMSLSRAETRLVRALLEQNREVAILAHAGGRITAEDLVVRDTLESECVVDTCPAAAGGFGVTVTDEASAIDLTRFRIEGSSLCGVQVAAGGVMDLHLGEVTGSPIGANVQSEGFDIERLQDRVRFVEVERKLDSTALPVPRPPEGL